jgi:hypothetical protein
METRKAPRRRRDGALPVPPLLRALGSLALGTFGTFGALGALEVRSDRLGLGATAARAAAALLVAAIASGLGAPLRAVRHRAFLAFLGFFADWRLATRLCDRVGDGLGDELDGADGVVVPGDRNRDQVRIGVRVDDGDDRDAKLVRRIPLRYLESFSFSRVIIRRSFLV